MATEINLIGGFYKSKTLPWSAQDVVNWVPVKSVAGGTRSPYKLRGLPGLRSLNESVIAGLQISGNAPDTTVGATYSFAYTASGGTPPYAFSLLSGSLPIGLSLSSDGAISGSATEVGTSEFEVGLSDSASNVTQIGDSITVTEPSSGIVFVAYEVNDLVGNRYDAAVPSGFVAGDYAVIFSAQGGAASTHPKAAGDGTPTYTPSTKVAIDGWGADIRGGAEIIQLRTLDVPSLSLSVDIASTKSAAVIIGYIPASYVSAGIVHQTSAIFGVGSIGPVSATDVKGLLISCATGPSSMSISSRAIPGANIVTAVSAGSADNVRLELSWAVLPDDTFGPTSFSGSSVSRSTIACIDLNGSAS